MKVKIVVFVATLVTLIASIHVGPAAAAVDAANTYLGRYFPAPNPGTVYTWQQADLFVENSTTASGYFYMHGFHIDGQPGGYGGYFGLQTRNGENPSLKGVIFSVWDAGLATPASGSYVVYASEAGRSFTSLRNTFQWGTSIWYRLVLYREQYAIHAWIYDLTYGGGFYMGAIGVPGGWGQFSYNAGAPVQTTEEYYPNSYPDCGWVLTSSVRWGWPYMGDSGGTWHLPVVNYPFVDPGCPNSFNIALGGDTYRQLIGAYPVPPI